MNKLKRGIVDRNLKSLKDDDGNFLTEKTHIANAFNKFFSTIAYQISFSLDIDIDQSNMFLKRTERSHSTFNLPSISMQELLKTITQLKCKPTKDIITWI